MNIALFASAFHPYMGGVEEHCRQVAHELIRQGHSPIVLTNRWPRTMTAYEVFEGIPIHRVAFRMPEVGAKSYVSYYLTHRQIRQEVLAILRAHEVDLLHVHCVSGNAHYARLAHRALRVPLIVTTHGEVTMDATRVFQRSAFVNNVLSRVIASADAVTACSRKTLDDLERHLNVDLRDRATVVYNGIRPEDFARSQPFSHPRPYVLGIGRLVAQKGFDVLVRAFARLATREVDLVLAGDGPEEHALRNIAQQLNLAGRIHFVGRADRPLAMSLFQGCSFFVLPSREEPMGIVNLEAMISGKAVIASRVGGVPEIVLENQTGLFVPSEDSAALATAMQRLIDDEALRQKLGAAGQARAKSFTWAETTDQYLNLYRKVTKRTPQFA